MPNNNTSSWSYIYLHNRRISAFQAMMAEKSAFSSFVFQARRRRVGEASAVPSSPRQLVLGGIVFIQGDPVQITRFFHDNDLPYRLVYDCATHEPARIADSVMRPLRQVAAVAGERLTFLPKPFSHYEQGHKLLRIVSGPLQGLEGCVLRIGRDRRLVMGVGNLTVAIADVHREQFAEAATPSVIIPARSMHRRLTYLQEAIDRNLFFPQSQQEVVMYAGNVAILLEKALQMCVAEKEEAATDTLLFLLEEAAYHCGDLAVSRRYDLTAVSDVLRQVVGQISVLTSDADPRLSSREKERLATGCDAFLLSNAFL